MDVMIEHATLHQSRNVPSVYKTVNKIKDIFGMANNTIPSVLITKENLGSKHINKQRFKRGKNSWSLSVSANKLLYEEQTDDQQTEYELQRKLHRRLKTSNTSRSFLPSIAAVPKTAGATNRKATSKRRSFSVLSSYDPSSQKRTRTIPTKLKKRLSAKVPSEEEQKIIRNIKFWREATPISRTENYDHIFQRIEKENIEESNRMITQEDTTVGNAQKPTWSNRFYMKNEAQKTHDGFYARHMALRDRLIEFETMHYREAVTRINRYREKLRRPLASRIKKSRQSKEENKTLDNHRKLRNQKKYEQSKRTEEDTRNINENYSPRGIHMSPSKEWKPFVGKSQSTDMKQVRKSTTIHKSVDKFDKHSHSDVSPKVSHKGPTPDEDIIYPIHIEKLLRDYTPQNTESNKNKSVSPTKTPTQMKTTDEERACLPSVEGKNDFKSKTEKIKDRKTNTILIDIRQQLNDAQKQQELEIQDKDVCEPDYDNGDTVPGNTRMLGTKLRLLLQKSSQSEREIKATEKKSSQEISSTIQHSKTSSGRRFLQKTSKFYPPEATRFPNVAKIGSVSMSLLKDGKQEFIMRGQQDSSRPKLKEFIKNHDDKGKLVQIMLDQKNRSLNEINLIKKRESKPDDKQMSNSMSKHHHRIKHPTRDANSIADKAKTKAEPNSISFAVLPTSYTQEVALRPSVKSSQTKKVSQSAGGTEKIRGTTKTNQVLNIPALATPDTQNDAMREKILQQQKEHMQARHMLLDPGKLAITSLTAEILNSALSLRAPSSSPIDFTKGLQQNILVTSQGVGLDGKGQSTKTTKVQHEQMYGQMPVNMVDGLSPPLDYAELRSKTSQLSLPKVSDLVDLQRLYQAVRRQNGISPFYVPTLSSSGITDLGKKPQNKTQIKKQPFYHYPYQNVDNLKQDDGVPLYIVTSTATKVNKPAKTSQPKSKLETMSWNYNYNKGRQNVNKQTQKKEINLVYNSPFREKQRRSDEKNQDSDIPEKYKGYTGVRGVFVTMSSSSKPLQQIEENSAT